MAHTQSKSDNFDFPRMISEWKGYVSSVDKTNVAEDILVQGSQNVYKKLSGNISVRFGEKRRGISNATIAPCVSEFVWSTAFPLQTFGSTYTMVVANSTLYAVTEDEVWHPIMVEAFGERYVFDTWWDNVQKKNDLLFVNGNDSTYMWSGGLATISSASNTAISIVGNNVLLTQYGAIFSDTTAFISQNNLVGTAEEGSMVFFDNPTNGQIIQFNINGDIVSVQFVSVIGAVAGNVLIGATLSNTLTNLVGLLQNPATSNATQVAFSGPDQTLIGYLIYALTNTITKTGTDTFLQSGFSTVSGEQKIMIDGVEYTYTGGVGTLTLFGIDPDASGIPFIDPTISQSVIEYFNTPVDNFQNDFLKMINNQVYVGSYESNLVYISSQTDFTDYVIPTSRVAGSPELVILDGLGKGIGVRQGNAVIGFGTSGFAIVSFSDVTVGTTLTNVTTVTIKPLAILQAPLAHEFISNVGDNIIYLSQDHQLREFGDFNNAFVAVYPSLSQEVATELSDENFTGGSVKSIGEFIYITAPASGKTYLRQERTRVNENGTVVSEKLWHSPFIWNARHVDQINGVVVVFSNANPQIYEVWDTSQYYDDSPSDEELPYSCVMALGYRGEQRRQGLWSFDKQFTEGYITPGTPLMLQINYNFNGSSNIVNVPINTTLQPGFLFQNTVESLGDGTLGGSSLGEGGFEESDSALVKFKVINSLPLINCFEWQPIFYSDSANAQWEIIATATNAETEEDQQATFLINKNRNL